MKKKSASKSAFLNPRVLISFAFCSIGVFLALLAFALYPGGNAFARQNQSSVPGLAQDNVTVLQGSLTQEPSTVQVFSSITPTEQPGVIDMAALGIQPLPAPLAPLTPPSPNGSAVGIGNAVFSISPEIGAASTTSAFAFVGANFIPAENVQLFLNGALAGTFASNANGRILFTLSSGAGAGFITVDLIGVTSAREAGGVVQVSATGPFFPGVAVGPHAINPTGTSTINVIGVGYPASTSVTFRRNGVSIGTFTTSATGVASVIITLAAGADASAVWSVDNATAGSFVGQTVEERADAGTPPVGDQNVARAFVDRAVINSAVGGIVTLVGEGFQAGETVTVSGCASGTVTADANNSVAAFLSYPAGTGASQCTLTGGTSGRVARATYFLDPSVTNIRGLIVKPAFVAPGGTVTVLADKMPASDIGNIYLDGVLQGTATTNAAGEGTFILTKPSTGVVHAVSWIATAGTGLDQATVLLLGPAAPTPTPSPTATATATVAPTPTPTATAGGTATPTPTPTPLPVCGVVVNPGFETGTFAGWTQSGDTGFTSVQTTNVHSGTYSAQLGPLAEGFLTQTFVTVPGQNYNVSFWLAHTSTSGTNNFSATFAGVTMFSLTNSVAFPYALHTANITATSASSVLQFAFSDSSLYYYLDDVCVTAVTASPTPTSTPTPTPVGTPTPTPACTPNYNFTLGTGNSIPATTRIDGAGCDDCTNPVTMPFPVSIYGTSFTAGLVGSNGVLSFGTNANGFSGSCLPVASATNELMPFYRDQQTNCTGGCGIFTATTGSAPNRVFTVEYKAIYFGETS
ncbi:MAG TPA: hypothetical protein VF345_14715, partial [Chthoniobacterales bacterium]